MMITRCPECATAFRISEQQLQARGGRVRCGRCREVFNALTSLETPAEAAVAEQNSTLALASVEEAAPPPVQPPPRRPVTSAPSIEPVRDTTYEAEFGGQRRARAGRLIWSLASVVLLLGLVAQALYYFRGAVAVVFPETKPYVYAMCAELGCEVPLPRRAELMTIETSDLQAAPASPGVILLSATLRNRAAFPQDYPALELTLTNERDQPLARRVVAAREYLRRDAPDGFPASSEQQVRLHIEAASLKASGYRLYLFYP
jgi:predicted Zn finger-like uncharacterized protein